MLVGILKLLQTNSKILHFVFLKKRKGQLKISKLLKIQPSFQNVFICKFSGLVSLMTLANNLTTHKISPSYIVDVTNPDHRVHRGRLFRNRI